MLVLLVLVLLVLVLLVLVAAVRVLPVLVLLVLVAAVRVLLVLVAAVRVLLVLVAVRVFPVVVVGRAVLVVAVFAVLVAVRVLPVLVAAVRVLAVVVVGRAVLVVALFAVAVRVAVAVGLLRELIFEQPRVDVAALLDVEGVLPEDAPHVDARLLRYDELREAVHAPDAPLHGDERLRRDEVRLVQQHPVGEGDLLLRLVHRAVRLLLVQVLAHVLRVDEGHHRVDAVVGLDRRDAVEREDDGRRVRHARGLQHDGLELLAPREQVLEGRLEVPADRAAQAAVVHDDHVLRLLDVLPHEGTVDLNLSELRCAGGAGGPGAVSTGRLRAPLSGSPSRAAGGSRWAAGGGGQPAGAGGGPQPTSFSITQILMSVCSLRT